MASMNEVIWYLPLLVAVPAAALFGGLIGYIVFKEFWNDTK